MPIFPAFSPAPSHHPGNRAFLRVFLATGLCICSLWALPAHAQNHLDEANQSFKAGQHAKALEQVNRHLSDKPKDPQGRFLKGVILTGMNKSGDAITVFQKLTEDYPDLPEPYNNLAVIYAQQKQYDKAKQALEMAIRTHPAYATAHENLGDIYSRLASEAYGKALQIDSSNASAQTKLSMINELVGGPKTNTATNTSNVGAGKTATAKLPAATPAPTAPIVVASADNTQTKPLPAVAPATPPTAKPAPAPTKQEPASKPEAAKPEPAKPGDLNGEVTAAVDAWLAAWSKKDVKGYLGYYAKNFEVPGGQSRKAWETERSQRVGKPGKIEVGRDKLAIKAEGSDKAIVRFRQNYKSAGFSSSSGKTLVLVKHEGKWLILEERVGG